MQLKCLWITGIALHNDNRQVEMSLRMSQLEDEANLKAHEKLHAIVEQERTRKKN